ncbi:MAG TPA: HEAT repeat domain-containing protein, partial [Phormidium sp.]
MYEMVTMIFTDLVNSTAVKNHLPGSDITARNRIYRDTILLPHRERVENTLASYGGRKVDTIGDAFFLVFPNPIQALLWAVLIQKSHADAPIPTPLGSLQLTIGMHTGCPLADGDNFIGQEVDYAARVAAQASAGQILLSEVTATYVRDARIDGILLHSHGNRHLKGIGEAALFEALYDNKQPQPLKENKSEKLGNLGLVIDWRSNCRNLLANRSRLTTNSLMVGDGRGFELDEIYVPLGLVERQQQTRYRDDILPEHGSQLYEQVSQGEEITQKFELEAFFEQVLASEKNRRIAIIGEPGAGKTTLLQKIARWIIASTEELPIWISLADLQGKALEQYLLEDWLKAATKKVIITPEIQENLGELFNSQKVWLLLDAVDEMTISSGNALANIAHQLIGWVASAKVILTCRLNVWDAGKNALEAFDTYRNLDFSYGDIQTPDQVGQFIRAWFKNNPVLGEGLRLQLEQPGRKRIKDTVKNPLRLALLCRTWARQQGELPSTKAGLYEQFVWSLYEWKQDIFFTTSTQRHQLNKALGQLAVKAISEETTKFRLRQPLIESVLNTEDEKLFQLALKLGFLNQVGVAAEGEHRGEKVYAFYHPTLQEYFAALTITDWHFFLCHVPRNPTQGNYRIFEPAWKEVILLWLGRDDIAKDKKEEFLKALVDFKDDWENFYQYRAYFLAAECIAEFANSTYTDEIVKQLIKWSVGDFNLGEQRWLAFSECITEAAINALTLTERSAVIHALIKLLKTSPHQQIQEQAIKVLSKVADGTQESINILIELIEADRKPQTVQQALQTLGKIASNNAYLTDLIINSLTNLSPLTNQNSPKYREFPRECYQSMEGVFTIIEKTCIENSKIINALIALLNNNNPQWLQCQAARTLGIIAPGNLYAINTLTEMIANCKHISFELRQAMTAIGRIGVGNSQAISTLINLLKTSRDEGVRYVAAKTLGQIGSGSSPIINHLIEILHSKRDMLTRCGILISLGEIGKGNHDVIQTLINLLQNRNKESELVREQIFTSLGKVGVGNANVIKALTELLQTSHDEKTLYKASATLGKVSPYNPESIKILITLLQQSDDPLINHEVALELIQIAPENKEAINTLIQVLRTSKNEFTRREIANSLKRDLQENLFALVVSGLKDLSNDEQCYSLLWHCSQNISYPSFYRAWFPQFNSIELRDSKTITDDVNDTIHSLQLAELSSILSAAVASDPDLKTHVKTICINATKFIDPDNPASKIYVEIVKQGFPKSSNGIPRNMIELQAYWELLILETEKRPVLIFYTKPTPQEFSPIFLKVLALFD